MVVLLIRTEGTMALNLSLTRISHELSAAAPDPFAVAALRLFGLLDVLSSTPPSPSRHAPGMALWAMQEECSAGAGIYSRATRWPGGFATKTREKCGLVVNSSNVVNTRQPRNRWFVLDTAV